MEVTAELISAEAEIGISVFEEAKKRINTALKEFKENHIPHTRSPCLLFDGLEMNTMNDSEMKALHLLFLHLCSTQDQRRWSSKSGYTSKGIRAYRGKCSRSGSQMNLLIHRNGRTSSKCKCKASFTLFSDGKVLFESDHSELCLPDPDMGNNGYVFNTGLSPSKRTSIVSNVVDLLSDYGTTPAAARKQIERSLVKSGVTGFAVGWFPSAKLFHLNT